MTTLPRPYCTQPRPDDEGCKTCSLMNYGRDCHNEPIGSGDHADICAADESEVAERLVRRWRVCLHEAGHAVAAWVFGKQPTLMLLMPDGLGGLASHEPPRAADSFLDAVAALAGPLARELELPMPSAALDVHLVEGIANAETRGNVTALTGRALSDVDAAAPWVSAIPYRAEARVRLVMETARALLAGHRADVERLAVCLWENGALDVESIAAALLPPSRETESAGT